MNNQINWQRLQVSMNNFKINQLMSFTDIQNKLFKQIQKLINPLVGYAKVEDPITKQLNHLYKQAKAKNPKAMKQLNLNAHKQRHMSTQQAMLQIMGQETKHENNKK
ncbi:MAG: Hypothetical protein AJITA_00888 [Acetilactobacillus jinshanensis]